ncbi:hypothetical protein PAXRUDRAFT_20431 [Paxillus rubicundulus Ve08.2h10]|uniref:Unplaced genomic scaffold scaffold_4542, whole genome shotgun sequence n=1 Tax=Paxillus rubicundulus Ve08.2h10 TaxID=930991 RepID=A0A0D0D9L2_9AGAM|nr:hypothetical protein PAXRUDRAFT_20431 [Paxillus rubicundulus Ve08.2h10]
MAADGDAEAALQAIEPLEHDAEAQLGLKICISLCLPEIPHTPPTLLELLNPPKEKEIRQGPSLEAN